MSLTFNVLNVFYNIRKTPDFAGKPVILPNPNRITLIALSDIWGGRFFHFGSKLVPKVIWFYLEISAKKSFKTYKFP